MISTPPAGAWFAGGGRRGSGVRRGGVMGLRCGRRADRRGAGPVQEPSRHGPFVEADAGAAPGSG